MTENLIQFEIDTFVDSLDGEVSSASRVIDAFLDLRLAGADHELFVMVVDNALASMPGNMAVSNHWIRQSLEELRGALRSPAAVAPTAS